MKLIRSLSLIMEKRFVVGDSIDRDVECLFNPGADELIGFVRRQPDHECRGIIASNGDLFVWDARTSVHQRMAKKLIRDGYIDRGDLGEGPTANFGKYYRLVIAGQQQVGTDVEWTENMVEVGPLWIGVWEPIHYTYLNPERLISSSRPLDRVMRRLKQIGVVQPVEPAKPKWTPQDDELLKQLRESDTGFQSWFAGSKVVDHQGRPLRVYHGTRADFEQFSTNVLGANTGASTTALGLFFTDSHAVANKFSQGLGGNVRPVFLRMLRPFVIEPSSLDYEMKKTSYEMRYQSDAPMRRHYKSGRDPFQQLHDYMAAIDPTGQHGFEKFRARLIERGFDGIIVRQTYMDSPVGITGGMHDFYIVMEPDQVRSSMTGEAT